MKKLITLLLALAGMAGTASADEVTIYFEPANWFSGNNDERFALWLQGDGVSEQWKDFTATDIVNNGVAIYKATFTTGNYNKLILLRMDGSKNENIWDNKWNQSGDLSVPSVDSYICHDNNTWDYWTYTPKPYFPWTYYFLSGSDNSWALDNTAEVTSDNNGVYTFSFSGETYANKRVTWATGDALNADGTLIPNFWEKVCKSKTEIDRDDWIIFANFSYNNVSLGSTGSAWYIPASDKENYNDGKITITFNSKNMSANIACTKTATIGDAGYATYSNGEKYTVSGADKVYVATGVSTNTVELTVMPSSTVFAANAGVILKGSGDVTINSVGSEDAYSGPNFLVGSGNSSKTVSSVENVYVFSWDGTKVSSVGFYAASGAGPIDAHKAYLDASGATSRFLSFSFGDEPSGINEVNAALNDDTVYNLQGVRMSSLRKGLNIVNGKKIMVK